MPCYLQRISATKREFRLVPAGKNEPCARVYLAVWCMVLSHVLQIIIWHHVYILSLSFPKLVTGGESPLMREFILCVPTVTGGGNQLLREFTL